MSVQDKKRDFFSKTYSNAFDEYQKIFFVNNNGEEAAELLSDFLCVLIVQIYRTFKYMNDANDFINECIKDTSIMYSEYKSEML